MSFESQTARTSIPLGGRPEMVDDATVSALEDLLRLGAAALKAPRCVVGIASPRDGSIRGVLGVASDEARYYAGFCTFAMMQAGMTVVADMRKVSSLSHLPKVRSETPLVWFAGGPLLDTAGVKWGGIAVLSETPRELSVEDRDTLSTLARQVVSQIEHRRRIEELWSRGLRQAGALSMLQGVLKASTTVAVIGTDLSGRIKLFSEGAERMFGVPARDAVGRTPVFLLGDRPAAGSEDAGPEPIVRSRSFSSLVSGVGRDTPVERSWLLRRADGSLFPASVVTAFVANESAEASGYAFIARDITEQRLVERMKDDFVSMVSHELRTPLTAIRGALGLLSADIAGPLTTSIRELVDIARANSDRLLYVVNDILDMQRLASGTLGLMLGEVDLASAAKRAMELVSPLSLARNVTTSVRRTASPGVVEADFERIVQVLVNLVSNAVKHSPDGATVHVDIDESVTGLRVSVEDQGPGIPEEHRSRLFQKFARLSDKPGSTGLGLAIVKAIVLLHNGTVAFHPASPHGAIFSIDLPLTQRPSQTNTSPPPAPPVDTETDSPISLRGTVLSRK